MTEEERIQKRKEYRRKWDRENRDKIREYKRNTAIRRVVKAINAGDVVLVERSALVANDEAR